ncbi:MAG: hypothetical protein L0H73_18580 [Nitrococcus sp.]|nr:hypothetical protein [Nitrococcus sp.]
MCIPNDRDRLLAVEMADGQSAEMAISGYEGVVGVALFLDSGSVPSRAVIQSGGYVLGMKANTMRASLSGAAAFTTRCCVTRWC